MPLLPVKAQRKLVRKIKELLVLSNRSWLPGLCARGAYDFMRLVIVRRLATVRGVRAVYLCHGLAAGECYPGLSDFDLVVVFDCPDPLAFYQLIRPRWGSLRRYYPINDLSIVTVGEFLEWQRIGGGWDPLDEVRHWKLLAGVELRRTDLHITEDAAAMDRIAWALGHFQNLLTVALKEEQRSRFMAIIARRQLYKCFWNTVHAQDPKCLAIGSLRERIEMWIRNNGMPAPVAELQLMHQRKFLSGPVTILRFSATALAWRLLDQALKESPWATRPLRRPQSAVAALPIRNHNEMEERARAVCASLREMMEGKLVSIMLGSTGSARGYALYVVLRDDLSERELADGLRDIRAIHRVFDDLWYNEHVPAGIPTVCSRAMFVARLQTGRSSLDYFEKYRLVLFGRDLYEEAVSQPFAAPPHEQLLLRHADWRREQLVYSMHLHQAYLRGLKPALYEYVTFHLPRLMLQRRCGLAPATAEEAVVQYAALDGVEQPEVPRRMLQRYEGKDLDFLNRNMMADAFNDAWPLLNQALCPGKESA